MYRMLMRSVRVIDERVLPRVQKGGVVSRSAMFTRNYLYSISWFWQGSPPDEWDKRHPELTLKRLRTSFVDAIREYARSWSPDAHREWAEEDKRRLAREAREAAGDVLNVIRKAQAASDAAGKHVLRAIAKDRIDLYKEGLAEFIESFNRARQGLPQRWETHTRAKRRRRRDAPQNKDADAVDTKVQP